MSKCPYCDKDTLFVEEVYSCGNCGLEHKDRDMPYAFALHERIDRLTAELAALREQVRWIPVSERLPQIYDDCEGEKSDCCYARDKHRCVWIAYYRPDEKDWYVLPTGIILTAVTHWMPLPPPPEEQE